MLPDVDALGSDLQSVLGSGPLGTQLSLILFSFFSPMSLSFPSQSQRINQRSDEAGVPWLPVGLGGYPMCRNVPDPHPTS